MLKRRDQAATQTELEHIDPAEPREIAGLQTAVLLARVEQTLLAARGHAPPPRRRRSLRRLLGG